MRGRKTAPFNLAPGDGNTGIEGLRGGSNKRGVAPEPSAPVLTPCPLSGTERGNYVRMDPNAQQNPDDAIQETGVPSRLAR